MGWDDLPPDTDLSKPTKGGSWDSAPPDPDLVGSKLSDLPENAFNNAGRLLNPLNIARGTADTLKEGAYDLPKDLTQGLAQKVAGVVTGEPQGPNPIDKRLNDIAESPQVQHPIDWAIKNPIDAAMTVATPLMAFEPPPTVGITKGIGEAMRNKGASLATDLGEVSGETVKRINPNQLMPESQDNIRMAGKTPNISDIRREAGAKLVDEGVVGGFGQDIGDRIQAANEKVAQWGPAVDKAYDAIKKTNRATGEYPDVADALHVDANPILKGLLDTANGLRDSARSGLRQTSRFWRETYNSLAEKAESNGGKLNLDDIRSELHDVGKDLIGNESSARVITNKDIYGHLADVRDQMVDQIADQSGDQTLAANLKNANKNYSFYEKIANGLRNSGAGGEVPENLGKHVVRGIMRGTPEHVVGFLGLRKLLDAVEPAMAQKLFKYGPLVAKYAQPLEAAARQGPKQLAVTSHLIGQNDPEYQKAMSQ